MVALAKFVWAVTSYGREPSIEVFAKNYCLHWQKKVPTVVVRLHLYFLAAPWSRHDLRDGVRSGSASGLSSHIVGASLVVGVYMAVWLASDSRCLGTRPLACCCATRLSRLWVSRWIPRSLRIFSLRSLLGSATATTTFRRAQGNHGGPTLP